MGEKIVGNRYEIIKKVGDGGMAHVYQARDKVLNRIVALKVLRQEFIDDDEFLGKFRREAESVANLSDPNIVNVFDVGRDNDVHYIVMEYVEGKNLKDIIRQEGILDEYSALDITKQIARALSHAHRKGIIHRDIKPHNILISNEGRNVKVTDFGIAKAVSNSTMTNVGNIIGSVHYFSPEQAKGKSVSKNADLYSLGIVLYEMITGRVPFRGDSPVAIALQHINESVEFGDDEITRIPQSVRTIIKKLTEKSPINRYQSAEELIDDIEYIEKNIDLDFIKEYDSYATKKTGELYNYKKTEKVTYENTLDNVSMDTQDEQDDSEKITRSKKQQEKKANKRLIIVAVILGIILLAQLAFFSLFLPSKFINSSGDVMPDVYNISLEDASRIINQLDIDATLNIREEYSDDVEVGFITSQSPIKGTKLSDGDIVNLVISKGSLEVYDASNDEVEEYIAPVEPPKEEVVEPEVEPEPYIPPSINIIGYTLEQAESMLTSNSLKLGNIKYEDNSEFDKGIVFSQTQNNDTYDVIVSNGPKQNSLLGNLFNKDEEEPEVETSTTDDLENESPQFELPQEDIVAPTVPQVEETIPVPEVSESIVPEIEQEEITPEITPDPAPPIVIPEPEEEIVPEELPEEQVVPDVVVPEVNEPEVTPEVQDNVLNEEYVEPENNSEEI